VNPVTHALISWAIGNAPRESTRRQRVLVTLGGLIPDIDGLGAPVDVFTRTFTSSPTRLFHAYHHELHCVGWAVAATALLTFFEDKARRLQTAALVFLTFHLHLLCDVVGAKGPDGSQWPIPYLLPFSRAWQWTVSWQWELNAWPNVLITVLGILFVGFMAVRQGRTILELFALKLDQAVVRTLRARFGAGPSLVEGHREEEGVLAVEAGGAAPAEVLREEHQEDVSAAGGNAEAEPQEP
jgi:hypothetical protein